MNNRRLFFSLLAVMKRKLWLARAISLFYFVLLAVACVAALLSACARFFVFLHLDAAIWITCGFGFLVWLAVVVYRRPTWEEAAHGFDSYGLDDRVATMLAFLDDESEIANLQRSDTLKAMKVALGKVKAQKTRWFYWRRAVPIVVLVVAVGLGFAFPNHVMEKASQMEKEKKIVHEKKDEVNRFVDKKQDKVNPEAKKELKKLRTDVAKSKKPDDLMDNMLEAEKQLDKMKKQSAANEQKLQRLEQLLKGSDLQGVRNALGQRDANALKQQMQALMKKINGANGNKQKKLLEQLQKLAEAAGQKGKVSDDPQQSLAALQKQLEKMMKSADGLKDLASAQTQLQNLAKGMNQQMAAAGLSQSGKLAFGGDHSMPMDNGQTGSGDHDSKTNGKGSGSGNGSGAAYSGNGSKSGTGKGSNSGSGNGSGAGSGSGSGSGKGKGTGSGTGGKGSGSGGSGAGHGTGNRNLLTVPKKLHGKVNKKVDAGKLGKGKSTKQLAPQSPIVPGKVRSYERVYGNYQSNYRESTDRMNLPGHLQTIVKDYFSEIAPDH